MSSDSIGRACTTGPKVPEGAAPTFSEGESSRTSSGKRASISALRMPQRIVLGVRNRRRVLCVIAAVVLGDLGGQARQLLGGLLCGQLFDGQFGCQTCANPAQALRTRYTT